MTHPIQSVNRLRVNRFPSTVRLTVRYQEKASWFELVKSWLEGPENMGYRVSNTAEKSG